MQYTSQAYLAHVVTYQKNYQRYVQAAASYIQEYLNTIPSFAIVLGSGLSDIAQKIDVKESIPYQEIPFFPHTTVPGHEGTLIIGTLGNTLLIGLKGRKHYYENAHLPANLAMLQTVFAVHVMAELGIENYFVTNAAGGLNPNFKVGDIMVIDSHINLLPNPLLGKHYPFHRVDTKAPTERFQPMNEAYSTEYRTLFHSVNTDYKKHIKNGTYLAVTGPTYETEAECIAFREGFKADAVGMSTTPEVIIARNRGMKVFGFSCITNTIGKDGTNATNHQEVKAILESPELKERVSSMVTNFFKGIDDKIE